MTGWTPGRWTAAAALAALAALAVAPAPARAAALASGGGLEVPLAALAVAALLAAAGALALYLSARRRLAIHHSVFASVPHPRQVVDADGRLIYVNAAFREHFGGDQRPIPVLLAEQTEDEEAREQLARLATNARNGLAGQAEVPVRARGREAGEGGAWEDEDAVEWRYVAAYPVSDMPGFVFWLVDDITLRRQMEQVIQEEQERFVDLLEHAPIGFYSVDGAGRFLFANRTLAEWLGLAPEDVLDGEMRLHDLVADPLPAGTSPCDPFGVGAEAHGEVRLKTAGGGSFEAYIGQDASRDVEGRVLRTRSVVRHLSRERAMAEALAQSERRFERFFQEAPVGIALIDGEGTVTECNQAAKRMMGLRGELAAGTPLMDMVAEESRQAVQAVLERMAKTNGGTGGGAPLEVKLKGPGEIVCALFITRTERDSEAGQFIVHLIDSTEQKTLEMQFAQSQKMQAVGQLAGGIAHDFNNLLTAMIGFSDLLLLRHRPGDQSFADIMQIKQNANRAANLVRQLLAFSRQQTLQPRVLSITDILAELSHLLRRLIGENIELKMIHGRDLGSVKADQGQLEQVIINLAVNARDAMAGGGLLTIRTGNVSLDRDLKKRGEVMAAGNYTRIEVSDTGCGISRENLDRIFEPFFSTKEVGDGTGLGLSTVYGIVKQTGGFVDVESSEAKGTTFSIYLPHHEASGLQEAEVEPALEANRDLTGMGRVLLVEDEDAVRAFSARALRNKGYSVLEARSGEAALELLNAAEEPIDLLITDVVMPRVDGPTLVREVREQRPDLKVIFISGYTEDTFRRRLDREAGIHFLSKPFSLKQLAGKVKEVMGEPHAEAGELGGRRGDAA